MIKINITKQSILTNSASFNNQAEADSWLSECIANESFGKPAYDEVITPANSIFHDAILAAEAVPAHGIIPAVFDSHGNEISPMIPAAGAVEAVVGATAYTEVIPAVIRSIPAEYTIEIADITAELALQKEKADALAFLAASDFRVIKSIETGIPVLPEFTAARAAARVTLNK